MHLTDYNEIIPDGVLFPLSEIEDMKLLKVSTAKKLIYAGTIECVKIGKKIHISRTELIRFLEERTVPKTL